MSLLEKIFNHLVLPVHTHSQQDEDAEELEHEILTRLIHACNNVKSQTSKEYAELWSSVRQSLESCLEMSSGRLEVLTTLRGLNNLQLGGMLILHVKEQNAALVIRRPAIAESDEFLIEVFEASPTSTEVLAARNALQWDFPGRAVVIPANIFLDVSFQQALAIFLEQASMEPLNRFMARSVKAKASVAEVRDTADPALISQMLLPLLEALGSYSDDTLVVTKRVRDDVNISEAEFPWRRLPLWLVLRVAVQTHCYRAQGPTVGRVCYKLLKCVMLSLFLEESLSQLAPELVTTLKAKLCRGIAKLVEDSEREQASVTICKTLLDAVTPTLQNIIDRANRQIEAAWANYKHTITRKIPVLPPRAQNSDIRLSLPNSYQYLTDRIRFSRTPQHASNMANRALLSDAILQQTRGMADTCYELARTESDIENGQLRALSSNYSTKSQIRALGDVIEQMISQAADLYNLNPEQNSLLVLNVFELWVDMDRRVANVCPLILEFHPLFTSNLLDVLQLSTLKDMERLQKIQRYINKRRVDCTNSGKSILGDIDDECFAVRYVMQSSRLSQLQTDIEEASKNSRSRKEAHWLRECTTYEELTRQINEGTCRCTFVSGRREVRGCKKCWHWRTRNRMKIDCHEDYLPKDEPQKAAAVFEMAIPEYLSMYRNTTWKIICTLGHPTRPKAVATPVLLLQDFTQLRRFRESQATGLTLASTKKSFLQTHFKEQRMKASLSDVVLPFGPHLSYYDEVSQLWIKDLNLTLTFQHLCGTHIPRGLRGTAVDLPSHPPAEFASPSSYEIVSSQTKCPSDMSSHEFMAYQRLLSGTNSRWMTMLVELGASSINFSSEDAMLVFCHLSLQAGPSDDNSDVLRNAHKIFRDSAFCARLLERIETRLKNIASNWRESHCMELLITLTLRLQQLTSGRDHSSAARLLEMARKATLQWTIDLRDQIQKATDTATVEIATKYGFLAALLCRYTFTPFARSELAMGAEQLCVFAQASLALQENAVRDLEKLPQFPKNMLVRDFKMAYHVRAKVSRAIEMYPKSLDAAIKQAWSESNSSSSSAWQSVTVPHDDWVVSTVTRLIKRHRISQTIHFNFVEGHLLVDGKPMGRLPREISTSEDIVDLFGNRHLLTYPTSFNGMTHRLVNRIEGHEIYFGRYGDRVIIQALTRDGLLEFIPRRTFTGNEVFDLPASLTDDCVHWLNLDNEILESRRKPVIWKTRSNDWTINVPERIASRSGHSKLLNPQSELFSRVSGIFRHFEESRRITAYQPDSLRGRISIELKGLNLSFFVNNKGLLECRELQAEIDLDQDAGTFYGLDSKLVLRDVANSEQRSIITATGPLQYKRNGMHVSVKAANGSVYGRFGLDPTLGRVTCAPEPLLIYLKARFHAYTSFVLPDPLTKRTGTEEALNTLRSGQAQPWHPLNDDPILVLNELKALSPGREYYPKDKRRLQRVSWQPELTSSIQSDSFESEVTKILHRSQRLKRFAAHEEEPEPDRESHLRARGKERRALYERAAFESVTPATRGDVIYNARDRQITLKQSNHVYSVTKMMLRKPFSHSVSKDLSILLSSWPVIGGFEENVDTLPSSLDEMIEVNVGEHWGTLVRFCSTRTQFDLIFRLALMSFSTKPNMDAIRVLVAFSQIDELKRLPRPKGPSFVQFRHDEIPTAKALSKLMMAVWPAPMSSRTFRRSKTELIADEQHRNRVAECNALATLIVSQWPNQRINASKLETETIDVEEALERAQPELDRLQRNRRLSDYVDRVQDILNEYHGHIETSKPRISTAGPPPNSSPRYEYISPSLLGTLILNNGPELSDCNELTSTFVNILSNGFAPRVSHTKDTSELSRIIAKFTTSSSDIRRQYGTDLMQSLNAFKTIDLKPHSNTEPPSPKLIGGMISQMRRLIQVQFNRIASAFSVDDNIAHWLLEGDLWPCITPVTILGLLRSSAETTYGPNLKEAIVSYGISITALQRLIRVRNARLTQDQRRLTDEWNNPGHENWNPLDYPDWLLIELESDIMIRSEQVDVAKEIISPRGGSNAVLQMNMGKGKTSCIVPMAAAVLANRKQLMRLIVPKALLLQTAQTLQSRLGALAGRDVRHIPFSRRTKTSTDVIQLYADLHRESLSIGGIILSTPEHVLSFDLSGQQQIADARLDIAKQMVSFQRWLTSHCRDVLDESDFTLAVKTQLIYPSGPQTAVDGHPYRWKCAQMLLSIVQDSLPQLEQKFKQQIEVVRRPGGFPLIYLLHEDVENEINRIIVHQVCEGRTQFLRLASPISPGDKKNLTRVITDAELDSRLLTRVESFFADASSARKNLLLVRGLIRNKILILCLKKRWNIQYGLHPRRHPIAVPFEAKGVPSEQAEFGHPDVSILFTCLAFYYSGLNLDQFSQGLQYVLQADDPAAEYDRWSSGSETLPEALHHWNVINVDDKVQLQELSHHLRYNRNVLDHYMNNFVFPLHAQQFQIKLQACGWDLPLLNQPVNGQASINSGRTTGFSGTNDNKMLLPRNITQEDLQSLQQTNAEVLSYLLMPRNRQYYLASASGKRLSEDGLLRRLANLQIRILIDAGAYIMEMDNHSLVKAWLAMDPSAKGAVFFGSDNRAWFLYRGGKQSPLLATPYAEKLDECLVYLDENHTRGVDMKFPLTARGALTLALGQTKDHTVQAAMRLRQLGSTQAVTFFAPPEVHQSIIDVNNMKKNHIVDSSHVVTWLLEQTCRGNEQLQSLYVAQGADFCRRTNAKWKNPDPFVRPQQRNSFLKVIQQTEKQTLEEMYGNVVQSEDGSSDVLSYPELQAFMTELARRKDANIEAGAVYGSALEEVEQEREVEHQVEEVRHVQKPVHYQALQFPSLHPSIMNFALTGYLQGAKGYTRAFDVLVQTAMGRKYNVRSSVSRLFVSAEFMRTVKLRLHERNDNFLRPVEWILWCPATETGLVIILEEAERLIPVLRGQKSPKVHLATYAAPITKNMLYFNNLSYYVLPSLPAGYRLPPWVPVELGILAGRLYFNHSEIVHLTQMLDLTSQKSVNGTTANGDAHVEQGLSDNPANFILDWLTLRRNGQDIMNTPMGYLCQGRALHENHSFFRARNVNGSQVVAPITDAGVDGEGEEEEVVEFEDDLEDDV